MGKNKIRSKDKARKGKNSKSDNSGSSIPSTSTFAHGNVIAKSTSNTIDRRHLLAEPFRRKVSTPTTISPKNASTSGLSSGNSPAAPFSRITKVSREEGGSFIVTLESPKWYTLLGLQPGNWWPCRALQWTYQFFVALFRIKWTEQQTFQDLVLTLVLMGMVIAGSYVTLDFLLRAVPGVAAQALDGNCSIVYVTVPGPIITVSLIGASPTNPARGTYYFSVINGTTEWLNSITPPSRFSTLLTRTAEITPVVSSLSITETSSSSAAIVSSTQASTTIVLSVPGPSSPGLDTTFTLSLTSGSTFQSSVGTGVSGSTPSPLPTLSSVSLPTFSSILSETSGLPRPINQPQRPNPSYPISTTVVTISSELSTTVTTISSFLLPSTFSMPSSTSLSSVVSPSSLPDLSLNVPSSTSNGVSSQLTSDSGLPLVSSVLTTLTSSLSDGLATLTTSTMSPTSSSVLSPTPSDDFTVSLPRPSAGSSISAGVSSSATTPLSPNLSLTSTITSSLVASPGSLTSLLDATSGFSSDGSTQTSSNPVLTSSMDSSSITLSTGSIASLSSSAVLSSLASILTSRSTSSLYSSSTPLISTFISSTSAGFATLFPIANSTSSLSTNLTFSSSALSISSTFTGSTIGSSSLASSSTSADGTLSIQTDTIVSESLPSSGAVSPSTLTSTLTLTTTTTSPMVTPSSPSGLNQTSLSSVRAVTKVISYGDAAVSFVFPSPKITTTMSYWTGTYPTVTGPLPSELQSIPLTTRTERQTPLSALPSFEIFSSRPRRFKTVITTIFEEGDESTTALARRQDIPITRVVPTQILETTMLATTTVALPDLPGPSSCGESGNFTLTFDDTVVGDDNNILLVANGMTNPYHHLFYANGYTYVPDMWEPYPAISQPNVAMFLPLTGRLLPNTPFAGMMLPGELGAGPRASVNAYWFNAYSAYFGCALSGLELCTLRVSGYRYDPVLKEEVLVAEQNATIPACFGYINCHLTQIFFTDEFRALSGIQFNAYTYLLGIPQVHMVDDLQMEWYNNTCSAGILRIGHS